MLVFIVILGIGLAAAGTAYQTDAQRAREQELLFAGDQFKRAISRYYERSPGQGRFPQSLDELLLDRRYPTPQRYLRRLYRDPITGTTDWGLVLAPDGGIQGVYSRSTAQPLKVANFPQGYESFADRKKYSDWQFVSDSQIAESISPGIPPPGR
jgi:type II secretory pathway pseudopilin PulG